MYLDPFWQQPLAAALTPPSQRSAPTFRFHARAKPMLAFAGALGWLVGAFHKAEKRFRNDSRAVTVGMSRTLSILQRKEDYSSFIRKLPLPRLFGITKR